MRRVIGLIGIWGASIVLMLLNSVLLFAQGPDTLWTRAYGGTDNDLAISVQECAEGGGIIAGGTRSFGAGRNDVYLLRTSRAGIEEGTNYQLAIGKCRFGPIRPRCEAASASNSRLPSFSSRLSRSTISPVA
jgi:hypothetical protein